ncbi:hypothetical protein [Herminiimonas fonticola]|uniref:hypothetical protein n=1 Tax=Herminiimonas fonticola TaxID=303380 RepID=UPI00105C6F41|nr:hypothetical protein [Herminiimonas fonticola]
MMNIAMLSVSTVAAEQSRMRNRDKGDDFSIFAIDTDESALYATRTKAPTRTGEIIVSTSAGNWLAIPSVKRTRVTFSTKCLLDKCNASLSQRRQLEVSTCLGPKVFIAMNEANDVINE